MVQKARDTFGRALQHLGRPSVVLRRVGQGSYVISTPGAAEQAVHEDQLKPFV